MTLKKNQNAWITGASSGIGQALAYELAKRGLNLILSARNEADLTKVAEQAKSHNADISTYVVPLDLTKPESIENAWQSVSEKEIKIDLLINNGGISQRDHVVDTSMEVYRRLMEVNYFGAVLLTKLVLPEMIRQRSGHIMATSSVVGHIGSPKRSGYAAAKHAIHGFYDSLRAEVDQHNIKVTLVCGGYIKTSISVNALMGDGSAQNKMDQNQEKGMMPEEAASKIAKALEANKSEIYIGGKEIMGIYMMRFFPNLLRDYLKKMEVK